MHVVNQVYSHLCHQDPSSYCVPFQKDPEGVPYAPCGAVANSMFNGTFHAGWGGGGFSRNHHILPVADLPTHILSLLDTFDLFYHKSLTSMSRVPLRRTGLTWYTDKNIKFRNPKTENQTLAQVLNGKVESSWILALLAAVSPSSASFLVYRVALQAQPSLRTGRSPCTSWTLPTRTTTASSTTTSSCGWGRRHSPTSRSSTGF